MEDTQGFAAETRSALQPLAPSRTSDKRQERTLDLRQFADVLVSQEYQPRPFSLLKSRASLSA